MGGYGSGWNRPKKATVEDALTLSITGLMRDGVIVPGEVRTRARGWCVNGRLVALSTRLAQGDKVEILTSKAEGAGPSRDWLGFVVSSRARQKIKAHFSRERRDVARVGRKAHDRVPRPRGLANHPLEHESFSDAGKPLNADNPVPGTEQTERRRHRAGRGGRVPARARRRRSRA